MAVMAVMVGGRVGWFGGSGNDRWCRGRLGGDVIQLGRGRWTISGGGEGSEDQEAARVEQRSSGTHIRRVRRIRRYVRRYIRRHQLQAVSASGQSGGEWPQTTSKLSKT